ncbi:MAG: hypothetical protein ACHQ4G_06330 [Opitutales bacterium]
MNRGGLLTALTLLGLWVLVTQVNHYLAVWHMYIFAGGLFVTGAALRLPVGDGMLATVLAGLLFDGNTPVPFGTHALLFLAAYAFLRQLSHRLPADLPAAQVLAALLANLLLFAAVTVVVASRLPARGAVWPRLIFDLLVSQGFLVLVGPWFFALQTRVLGLARSAEYSRF